MSPPLSFLSWSECKEDFSRLLIGICKTATGPERARRGKPKETCVVHSASISGLLLLFLIADGIAVHFLPGPPPHGALTPEQLESPTRKLQDFCKQTAVKCQFPYGFLSSQKKLPLQGNRSCVEKESFVLVSLTVKSRRKAAARERLAAGVDTPQRHLCSIAISTPYTPRTLSFLLPLVLSNLRPSHTQGDLLTRSLSTQHHLSRKNYT